VVVDSGHEHALRWRPGRAPEELAVRRGVRDAFTCDVLSIDGEALFLVNQGGRLRGRRGDGTTRFDANLSTPHAYDCHRVVALPGQRGAIVGALFGDPHALILTVAAAELLADPDAVQRAIETAPPVHDFALHLAIGPAPDLAAVVARDPEDEEPPEDADDETHDLWGHRGFYLRDLASGAVVQRIAYAGPIASGATMVATARSVAIEVRGGVDVVDRDSAQVDRIAGPAAIDPVDARVAALAPDGTWTITHLPR
jgi:hypothetical protein